MRSFVFFSLFAFVLSVLALDWFGPGSDDTRRSSSVSTYPRSMNALPQPENVSARRRSTKVVLRPSADGHFRARVEIGTGSLEALVDTGATYVALRRSDARQVGIKISKSDMTTDVMTANGIAKAALVVIDEIAVGSIKVRDVKTLVLPDRSLSTNLLGLSFLNRLERYTFSRRRLILEN